MKVQIPGLFGGPFSKFVLLLAVRCGRCNISRDFSENANSFNKSIPLVQKIMTFPTTNFRASRMSKVGQVVVSTVIEAPLETVWKEWYSFAKIPGEFQYE